MSVSLGNAAVTAGTRGKGRASTPSKGAFAPPSRAPWRPTRLGWYAAPMANRYQSTPSGVLPALRDGAPRPPVGVEEILPTTSPEVRRNHFSAISAELACRNPLLTRAELARLAAVQEPICP